MPALAYETYVQYDTKGITREQFLAEAAAQDALIGPMSNPSTFVLDTCRCRFQIVVEGHSVRVLDSEGTVRETYVRDESIVEHHGEVFSRCQYHAHLADPVQHFAAVMGDNRLKNSFERELRRALPEIIDPKTKLINDETPYAWSFDESRKLVVNIRAFSPLQRAVLGRLAAEADFNGRVILDG